MVMLGSDPTDLSQRVAVKRGVNYARSLNTAAVFSVFVLAMRSEALAYAMQSGQLVGALGCF